MALGLALALGTRARQTARAQEPAAPSAVQGSPAPRPPASSAGPACGASRLTVHVYDVGQGLAALVDLPDGRHVLVDTGDGPRRAGCEGCAQSAERLQRSLRAELGPGALALLWITHQHADHVGGASGILDAFPTATYVDNGREPGKAEVRRAHLAAGSHGVTVRVVDPEHRAVPLESSATVRLQAIVPASWPPRCSVDPNECSIGLRIEYCASSILFTGDAEHDEEAMLDPGGPVTLLQVAHHGSETSTTPGFLARARPRYAVLSAGKPGEGLNRDYCHPRALVVQRLSHVLGGKPAGTLQGFDGERCDRAVAADWVAVPTTDRLWATERDGDVTLSTTGDGTFERQ